MISFGKKLAALRRGPKISLADLAKMLKTSVSADYLISGSIEDNAEQTISDKTLLAQFKKVEQLTESKKKLVKGFLDAFIMKRDLQKQLAT